MLFDDSSCSKRIQIPDIEAPPSQMKMVELATIVSNVHAPVGLMMLRPCIHIAHEGITSAMGEPLYDGGLEDPSRAIRSFQYEISSNSLPVADTGSDLDSWSCYRGTGSGTPYWPVCL